MDKEHYVLIVYPIMPQFRQLAADRAPISIGIPVRTADGAFLKNYVKIGDRLPLWTYNDAVVAKFVFGDEAFGLEEIHIKLFSNISTEETVELDHDLNGDPELEIRAFAEVFVKMPEELPDEMTVRTIFRFDEKGVSVWARREDTGEYLETRMEQQ